MTKSWKRNFIALVFIVFVLLAILIVILDWNEVHQIMGKAQWQFTLVALLFSIIYYFCLNFGYVMINRAFGIGVGWWKLFEVGIVSTILNNLLGFLGAAGLTLRIELIKGSGIDTGEVAAASIFHSYLDNVMLILFFALGLIYLLASHTVYGGSAVGLGVVAAILVVFLIISTAIIFVPQLKTKVLYFTKTVWHFFTHRDITSFLTDFNQALTHGLVTLKSSPWKLTLLLGLMAGEWAFQAGALWFCFAALGNVPNLGVLLSGFGIGILAGNLSFVPGGLGVQEASMAGVYALLGISFAQAGLVAILFRVVSDFIPFFISLPFYTRLIRKASLITKASQKLVDCKPGN